MLAAALVIAAVVGGCRSGGDHRDITFTEVIDAGRAGALQRVEVDGASLRVRLRDDRADYRARAPAGTDGAAALQDAGVTLGDGSGGTVELTYGGHGRDWGRVLLAIGAALGVAVLAFGAYLALPRRRGG